MEIGCIDKTLPLGGDDDEVCVGTERSNVQLILNKTFKNELL